MVKVPWDWSSFSHHYEALKSTGAQHDGDTELKNSSESDVEAILEGPTDHRIGSWNYYTALNVLVFVLSLWLFAMSMISFGQGPQGSRERNHFLKQTSEHSPLLDLIDIPMRTVRLNGTFLEARPVSIFRQPPSPEVDAAWARIETQAPIAISYADVVAQGKDPAMAAKFPESFGLGSDAYIGRVDVFHQIHCLNRLRMHLQGNYDYYYGKPDSNNRYHELHVSHCVYMLLQNLMCTANVDVYPHTWLDAQQNAFPDFSINHKCRDFEAILQWHDDNSIPLEDFGALRKPENFTPHIMNHEFKTVFQWYDDHPDDGDLGNEIM
ncbi:hypothetical protein AAFC00_001612 [Neodothiora populina]|uniref:Tat pathway signal sequence n=1 Tax=Neodothiora populina TaxID=2781224 RepID=A0ABR3PPL5_9PEZI